MCQATQTPGSDRQIKSAEQALEAWHQWKAGDERKYDSLVVYLGASNEKLAFRLTREFPQYEDLVRLTLKSTIHESLNRFSPTKARRARNPLLFWHHKVSRDRILNELDKEKAIKRGGDVPRLSLDNSDHAPIIDDTSTHQYLRDKYIEDTAYLINLAKERLGEMDRELIEDGEVLDMSTAAIARKGRFGKSWETVSKRREEARRRLQVEYKAVREFLRSIFP